MFILINHLPKLISQTELPTDNKLILILHLNLELRELEKIKTISSGPMVKFTVWKTWLLPLRKNSKLAEVTQRKFRILLIDLTIRKNHLDHKTLRKVLRLFTKLWKHIEHLLTTPRESNIIHPIERNYYLFLSSQPEELKKLVQNKDKKSGAFLSKFMEVNGTNLINLTLTHRRKSRSLTMKISSTNMFLRQWTLKVTNSKT